MPETTQLDSDDLRLARAALARATRAVKLYPEDEDCRDELAEASAAYKEAKTAHFLRSVINSAPPLTSEARARLAALLAPVPVQRKRAS